MVDFILFIFAVLIFSGGFWCGNKYGTVKAMVNAMAEKVCSWVE